MIYNQIKNSSPIRKDVFNVVDKSSIEHYYFIIPVNSKNIKLTPNPNEIYVSISLNSLLMIISSFEQGVEWHNVYTLPYCNNCQIKKSIQSKDSLRESNYFMVTCTDKYGHNSLVE
jgi:hypothetical protein